MPATIAAAPAATVPCGRYSAYTTTPASAQTPRYDPANSGAARSRPLARARRTAAGAAPGSIMAAIITSHKTVNDPNGPSLAEAPMSIPLIRWIAMTQQAAATPSVTARAPVRRAVLPAAAEGRAAVAMPATGCPLVWRTFVPLFAGDGLGRDGLRLQESGVLALKRLGRPHLPAVGEGGGQGIGEDVLLGPPTPSKMPCARDWGEAFGMSRSRTMSVSTGPVSTAWTRTPCPARSIRSDWVKLNAAALDSE